MRQRLIDLFALLLVAAEHPDFDHASLDVGEIAVSIGRELDPSLSTRYRAYIATSQHHLSVVGETADAAVRALIEEMPEDNEARP